MKKYEYERIYYGGVVFNKLDGHREIIDRRAAEGWRYVDHICVQETSGLSAAVDLIFEKDVEGEPE